MIILAVVVIIIIMLLIFLFCACKNSSIWSRHEERQYLEYIKNNKDNKGE